MYHAGEKRSYKIQENKYRTGLERVVTAIGLIIFVVIAGYTVNIPSFGGKDGWDGIGTVAASLVHPHYLYPQSPLL